MDVFLQQVINGLVMGSMYALVALGYTMVYGIINLINFAHGEVLMVGALTSWTAIGMMRDAMPGAPGWVILILATLIAHPGLIARFYAGQSRFTDKARILMICLRCIVSSEPKKMRCPIWLLSIAF